MLLTPDMQLQQRKQKQMKEDLYDLSDQRNLFHGNRI